MREQALGCALVCGPRCFTSAPLPSLAYIGGLKDDPPHRKMVRTTRAKVCKPLSSPSPRPSLEAPQMRVAITSITSVPGGRRLAAQAPRSSPAQSRSRVQILPGPFISLFCSAPVPFSPVSVLSPRPLSGARGQLFGSLAKGYSAVTSFLLDKLCKPSSLY